MAEDERAELIRRSGFDPKEVERHPERYTDDKLRTEADIRDRNQREFELDFARERADTEHQLNQQRAKLALIERQRLRADIPVATRVLPSEKTRAIDRKALQQALVVLTSDTADTSRANPNTPLGRVLSATDGGGARSSGRDHTVVSYPPVANDDGSVVYIFDDSYSDGERVAVGVLVRAYDQPRADGRGTHSVFGRGDIPYEEVDIYMRSSSKGTDGKAIGFRFEDITRFDTSRSGERRDTFDTVRARLDTEMRDRSGRNRFDPRKPSIRSQILTGPALTISRMNGVLGSVARDTIGFGSKT